MRPPAESSATGYHPPALGKRALGWRILLAAFLSLTGVVQLVLEANDGAVVATVLNLVGGTVAWVAVFFRRRWPLLIAIVCGCAGVVSGLAGGPALWALFSLATTRRWRHYVVASVVVIPLILAAALLPEGMTELIAITDEAGS